MYRCLGPAGELEQAKQQAELCIQQAEAGGWMDSAGRPLRLRARQTLWRIYSRLADAPLDAKDYDEALTLLHEGYSMAIECMYTQSVCETDKLIICYQVSRLITFLT